jgi:hypothetical protein
MTVLQEQEARLLAVNFEIVNAWAEVWVEVQDGVKTVQEAFDEYNAYLVPIGQMLAIALSLPGVTEQVEELIKEYSPQE